MLFWLTVSVVSQELRTTDIISTVAEELAEEMESDMESCLERLSDLSEDPVTINSASEDEISRLFFLTPFQVKELCSYVKSTGQIVSIYEIASIPGFTRETAAMMLPFITFEKTTERTRFFGHVKSTLLTNLTLSGKPDTSWAGSHARLLSKYKITSGRITAGLTLDKDPGEKLFSDGKPEFLSGYVSYKGSGIVRKVIAGDFSARFGHGTAVNTSYGMGLPLTSTSYLAARSEVRPYTSSAENSFFRGVTAELAAGRFSVTAYLSSDLADASLSDDSLRAESLHTTGLHRTNTEYVRRDNLRVVSHGISIRYDAENVRAGFVWTRERLSLPLIKEKYETREIFSFSGNRGQAYSVYYSSRLKRILVSGELSFDNDFSRAFVQSVSSRITGRFMLNALYRSYEPGYSSLHGSGPGASAGSWNERSVFTGFTYEAARHLFVAAGCDFRSYPWLRYRCTAPSTAIRQEVRIRYLPAENLSAELLYNFRRSSYDVPESPSIPVQEEISTNYLRGSVRYSPSDNLTLTTRLDWKSAGSEGTGMAFVQDLVLRPVRMPLTFWFRHCIYRISDWDARIYTYENDLLYSFSIPALSGNGSRSYIMVKYEAGDFAEFRFKFGSTVLETGARGRHDFRFQARLFF